MSGSLTRWARRAAGAVALTALAGFGLVFSEWLFFVTKPSFLLSADLAEHLRILAVTPWLVALPCLLGALALALPALAVSSQVARHLVVLGGALLVSVLVLLMVDNFTYTLFQVRIFDLAGWARWAGLGGWLALLACVDLSMARWLDRRRAYRPAIGAAVVLALAAVTAVLAIRPGDDAELPEGGLQRPGFLPNIVIFSADGLDIRRLSAFGYARATSPFLERILGQGLVFENYFTNSATTTGSAGALLTGRLPTTTRVNFRPDLYRDADAYRHLPAVLRTLGYHNAEITVRYYNDADDFNLRQAFHWANGRSLDPPVPLDVPPALLRAWNFELYFLRQVLERAFDRLAHLFAFGRYTDPFGEVVQKSSEGRDAGRLGQLRDVIQTAREPFFVNTHFMVTHGPKFPVYTRQFSAGQQESGDWMTDFYDDALLDVDQYLNFLFDFLQARGQLERTLIVYTTDHGERSRTAGSEQRLPLVFFFPGGQPAGRVTANAQRVDIAPTLLDYLGVGIPDWMEGRSLLAGDIDRTRPIVGTGTPPGTMVGRYFEIPDVKPPLYTLDKVYLIQCQRYWRLHLDSGRWQSRRVPGHTDPCPGTSLFDDREAKQYLIEHLLERDYPPAALRKAALADPPVRAPADS